MIEYQLIRFDPDAHEFHVRMRFDMQRDRSATLRMPAWIPGSYMIRDFARNLTAISATDATGAQPVRKIDKQTWRVDAASGYLVVDYSIYAFDLSVRSAYLDRSRAYFNGTSLFLAPDGLADGPWSLTIGRPTHAAGDGWQVATTLPGDDIDDRGFGRYRGTGIDLLYDCPVEIGTFERLAFDVSGVSHEMIVSDGGRFDCERIKRDLAPICAEHVAMFGNLPVSRYLFMTLATGDAYGGLEHLDSTSLVCKRSDLPRVGLGRPDKGYRQFLGLCSHEYFHLWNVKRIRPAALAAADLSAEVHTELLWAFEGITSYYDELALVRSGALSADDYLDLFATTVTRVMRGRGRHRQSIAESSFDAWTRFYKQDENAPNAIVSYYAKGALVAFGLDQTIRDQTDGRLSLDDLMRALWQRFGRTATGVPERGIERILAELTGQEFDGFFARYVYGTDELPLADWFDRVGVGYRLRAAKGSDDQGGRHVEPPHDDDVGRPVLGARVDARPEGAHITHVADGGAAHAAGLAAGDVLVAIDGERVRGGNAPDLLRRAHDDQVEVHYFRRDRLCVASLPLLAGGDDTCDLWLIGADELRPEQRARRTSWLRSARERAT